MIRTFEEATLLEMAEHATVPVINGLTNRTHPCQIMADVMTYEEHRGPIAGRKVVWCGDGNNVCASLRSMRRGSSASTSPSPAPRRSTPRRPSSASPATRAAA